MTVTKAQLDALASQRHSNNAELHLRPDNATVAYVHSSLEAQRIGQLNQGHRVLQIAHEDMTVQLRQAKAQGFAKAQFQMQSQAEMHTDALNP